MRSQKHILTPKRCPKIVFWNLKDISTYRTYYLVDNNFMNKAINGNYWYIHIQENNFLRLEVRDLIRFVNLESQWSIRVLTRHPHLPVKWEKNETAAQLVSYLVIHWEDRTCMPLLRYMSSWTSSQSNCRFPGSSGSLYTQPEIAATWYQCQIVEIRQN